jgi:type I restriction enzyme S subunit
MNEEQNINQLPKDWKWVKLGDVGKIETGTTPSKSNAEYYGKEIPFFKPTDLQQGINTITASDNLSKLGFEKTRKLPKDSILVTCIGATIGKTGLIKVEGASNQQINSIIPDKQHNPKFVFYQVISHSFQNQIKDNSSSTTLPILNKSKFQQLDFITTTFDSQQAIVSKIEELFSELDKGIENLRTAQQQLKTYRQSVLKWAFEGKLTNENIKEAELPKGWKLTKLGEYIEDISSGKSYRCDERPPKQDEVGIVKVSSVTWGFFDEMESKTCFSKDFLNTKYLIKTGDFLFSRANTIEFIGACVIVNKIDKTLMLSDKILRFTFPKGVSKEYVLYYLRSRKGRKQIETLSTGNQDSMRNIGQEKIRQIEFPYCSIEEQKKIIQEIENRLSVADKMEESITQSLQQAEALRQSILKKAFEGRLVK